MGIEVWWVGRGGFGSWVGEGGEGQAALLEAFFAIEQRLFLTGGGALAGFYLGHRITEDLDLFAGPPRLDRGRAAIGTGSGGLVRQRLEVAAIHTDFRRLLASRGGGRCVVDLVLDRAPMIESTKATFGSIRVDTLREITAARSAPSSAGVTERSGRPISALARRVEPSRRGSRTPSAKTPALFQLH